MGFSRSFAGNLKGHIFQPLQGAVCYFHKVQISTFYLVFNSSLIVIQGYDFSILPDLEVPGLGSIRQIAVRFLHFRDFIGAIWQPVFFRGPQTVFPCLYRCDHLSRLIQLAVHQNCLCRTVGNREFCSV